MLNVNFQSVCHLHPLTDNDRFKLKSLKINCEVISSKLLRASAGDPSICEVV